MNKTDHKISECVVCYDKKASYTCIGCKKSSGVCKECYDKIPSRDNSPSSKYYGNMPLPPCVICKYPMRYAELVKTFNKELDKNNPQLFKFSEYLIKKYISGYDYCKCDRLKDILLNNRFDLDNLDYSYKKNKLSSTYKCTVLIQSVIRRYISNIITA